MTRVEGPRVSQEGGISHVALEVVRTLTGDVTNGTEL